MIARLRERFWKWLYDLAERRWDRAYDDAHPDQGPIGDAGGYRWVVEDVAYAPGWSAPDPAALRVEYATQRPFSDLKDTTR